MKVMDKQYEPLIQALLTDMNENDVDRIYESLYVSCHECGQSALIYQSQIERENHYRTLTTRVQ